MGGSRAETIAHWVSHQIQVPVKIALKKTHSFSFQKRQAELGLKDRLENRLDFEIDLSHLTPESKVILVDDFITTGRTVSYAAKILRTWGVREVHVFALGIRCPRLYS